jgi:[ribosomal protein S5]-alanine N-acetyltransferase
VHSYACDPEFTRYQSWGPNDEDATREFIRRSAETFDFEAGDDLEFAIVDRESSRVLGGCGIHARRKQFREYEIGWTISRSVLASRDRN